MITFNANAFKADVMKLPDFTMLPTRSTHVDQGPVFVEGMDWNEFNLARVKWLREQIAKIKAKP